MEHAASAITDVTVCVLPRAGLFELLEAHPKMAIRLACIANRDQLATALHLANVGRRTARGRVASLLHELFERVHGQDAVSEGETVPLPLTQE